MLSALRDDESFISSSQTNDSEANLDYKTRKMRKAYRLQYIWFGYTSIFLAIIMLILTTFSFASCFFASSGFFRITSVMIVVYSFLGTLLFLIGYRMRLSSNYKLLTLFQNVVVAFGVIGVIVLGLNCYDLKDDQVVWNLVYFVSEAPLVLCFFLGYACWTNLLAKFVLNHRDLAIREQSAMERRYKKRKLREERKRAKEKMSISGSQEPGRRSKGARKGESKSVNSDFSKEAKGNERDFSKGIIGSYDVIETQRESKGAKEKREEEGNERESVKGLNDKEEI